MRAATGACVWGLLFLVGSLVVPRRVDADSTDASVVVGATEDARQYGIRIVEYELGNAGPCGYPSVQGIKPLRVELRLCRVGVDCSEKWVIYEKANPKLESGVPRMSRQRTPWPQRSEATPSAGVQLLSAPSSGLSVLHNGFTIPQSVMKEQGFDFSVDVVWEWIQFPMIRTSTPREWRLLAKAAGRGPSSLTGRSSTTASRRAASCPCSAGLDPKGETRGVLHLDPFAGDRTSWGH